MMVIGASYGQGHEGAPSWPVRRSPRGGASALGTARRRAQNEVRVDELGPVVAQDGAEQRLAGVGLLGGDHRANGEGAQCVGDRQRSLGRILAPGERKDVGSALALAVDVDAA